MKITSPRQPYGQKGLSIIDRWGIFLSLVAIKKYFPKNRQLEVLDIGCGYNAKLLVALHAKIKKGIGIDFCINPSLKNISNLDFIESSFTQALSSMTLHPDIILMNSVLEHLDQPLNILKSCYELLPENGRLFINVPTWRGKFFLEFSAFRLGTSPKEEMDDHKMYYDKRDLWPLLVEAGFKPSKIQMKYHKFGLNLFSSAQK